MSGQKSIFAPSKLLHVTWKGDEHYWINPSSDRCHERKWFSVVSKQPKQIIREKIEQ